MVIEKHMDVVVNPGSAEEIMLCQCGSIDGNRVTVYCPLHNKGELLVDNITKWDIRMMEAARYFGTWSKCLSRGIGAVIVRDKTILSTGYNGPPRGVHECHTKERLDQLISTFFNAYVDRGSAFKLSDEWGTKCPRQILGFKSGEGMHLCTAGHAEANAVANAAREGVRITGATMYCHCGLPCQECAKMIIGGGISKIYHLWAETDYDTQSRWMLNDAGVLLIPISSDLLAPL